MQLTRPMILLIVGTAVAVGVIRLTFLSVSKAQSFAGCPADLSQTGIYPTQTIAIWNNLPITPMTTLAETLSESQKQVLGTSTDEKWIEVDLRPKLIAHQGNSIFLESLISSGVWGKPRPENIIFGTKSGLPKWKAVTGPPTLITICPMSLTPCF